MHLEVIATLWHPGDLSIREWAGLFGVFVALVILPIVIMGFIVFKIISGHRGGTTRGEPSDSITFGLTEPDRK